jgi:uncharacterized protein YqhQ
MEAPSAAKPYVGGQAVLEGVMMRAPRSLAIAVRRPDGTIIVREGAWVSIWERLTFLRWPFFRGAVVLLESLFNGIQALNFSAQHAVADDEVDPAKAPKNGAVEVTPAAEPAPVAAKTFGEKDGGSVKTAGTIALSLALAMGLFVGVPHLLTWGAGRALGADLDVESFAFHLIDGIFKLAIFVGYIAAIARIPEIRRVFQYHGAEHMVVNTYENNEVLTVENAKKWTTFHARCGTSFILFVLVLSILLFAAVFPFIPRVSGIALVNHVAMIFIKVPLMIPLSGIAYEINRYASKHPAQLWVQALVLPGRLMQKLTTRPPTEDQLEIALSAMRAALRREAELKTVDADAARAIAKSEPVGGQVAVFRDFTELARAIPSSL